MGSNGRIQSVVVGTAASIPLDLGLQGSKVIIHTTQDIRVAYDENNLGTSAIYFIIPAQTILVFDQPTPFDSHIWLRADSAEATVRTWVMGADY